MSDLAGESSQGPRVLNPIVMDTDSGTNSRVTFDTDRPNADLHGIQPWGTPEPELDHDTRIAQIQPWGGLRYESTPPAPQISEAEEFTGTLLGEGKDDAGDDSATTATTPADVPAPVIPASDAIGSAPGPEGEQNVDASSATPAPDAAVTGKP